MIDRWMNISLILFNGMCIALIGFDQTFWAGVAGLFSEPAFGYFSWKAKSWGLFGLTIWYTIWYSILIWRNW